MLIRILTYKWTCDKCGKKEKRDFNIEVFQEYPILRDPLEGWMKYVGPNPKGEEHWCPDCVKKLIK